MTSLRLLLPSAALLLASTGALAQPSGGTPPSEGRPPGPPPEAVAACQGKANGAQASFTGRRGETVTGTCQTIQGVFALRPDRMPPQGPRPGASQGTAPAK